MLFDDDEFQYAGDALLATPDPATTDAFDTSNLAGDLGTDLGDVASMRIHDHAGIGPNPGHRSVQFVNDGDTGIYYTGARFGSRPQRVGQDSRLANPVEENPFGQMSNFFDGRKGSTDGYNYKGQAFSQDKIMVPDNDFSSDVVKDATTDLLNEKRSEVEDRSYAAKKRRMQQLLGINLLR